MLRELKKDRLYHLNCMGIELMITGDKDAQSMEKLNRLLAGCRYHILPYESTKVVYAAVTEELRPTPAPSIHTDRIYRI